MLNLFILKILELIIIKRKILNNNLYLIKYNFINFKFLKFLSKLQIFFYFLVKFKRNFTNNLFNILNFFCSFLKY